MRETSKVLWEPRERQDSILTASGVEVTENSTNDKTLRSKDTFFKWTLEVGQKREKLD